MFRLAISYSVLSEINRFSTLRLFKTISATDQKRTRSCFTELLFRTVKLSYVPGSKYYVLLHRPTLASCSEGSCTSLKSLVILKHPVFKTNLMITGAQKFFQARGVLLASLSARSWGISQKDGGENRICRKQTRYPVELFQDAMESFHVWLRRRPLLPSVSVDRLGGGPDDAKEIMRHSFFGTIDWQDVYDKKVRAGFRRHMSSSLQRPIKRRFSGIFGSGLPHLSKDVWLEWRPE